jgi:hypothetical protein
MLMCSWVRDFTVIVKLSPSPVTEWLQWLLHTEAAWFNSV